MRLRVLVEAGLSRRSFLRGIGKAGALAAVGPRDLLSGGGSVVDYGSELYEGLSGSQKGALDSFMFYIVNNAPLDGVDDLRNSRFPLRGMEYVIRDGIVNVVEPTEGGGKRVVESFPVDATFGVYDRFNPDEDLGHFLEIFLSGENTVQFFEGLVPGSVSGMLDGFIDRLGIEEVARALSQVGGEFGGEGWYWMALLPYSDSLQRFLGLSGFDSVEDKRRAVGSLVEKGLLPRSEAAFYSDRYSAGGSGGDTGGDSGGGDDAGDTRLADMRLASSMHQPFEERLRIAFVL